MSALNTEALRDEAYRTGADLDERVFTNEALRGTIIRLCRRLFDAADDLDAARSVAHAAWHLLDDSGETAEDGGRVFLQVDYEKVSSALDTLEATGWQPAGHTE